MNSCLSPAEAYAALLAQPDFLPDPAQEEAVALLDDLHRRLLAAQAEERSGPVGRLFRRRSRRLVQGLYLWGGVGRGKTRLMDLFCECLPPELCQRMHFHRFMQYAHQQLTALAGTANPLQTVAEGLAEQARVLCFDEFFVSDIGDAMILAELLGGLFERGVTLVATSNVAPAELYSDGLQRRRFLPAIKLLETHTRVHRLDGGVDYRLRALEQAEIYHVPLDGEAEASLMRSFKSLAPEPASRDVTLEVLGRPIRARLLADDVAWFEFAELCEGPRSQNDYIELARCFHAVLLANVRQMSSRSEDTARRFISLVDEFYDRNVKLILSAEVPIPELYRGERLRFEFERTSSRLLEMQSHDYLARSHRA